MPTKPQWIAPFLKFLNFLKVIDNTIIINDIMIAIMLIAISTVKILRKKKKIKEKGKEVRQIGLITGSLVTRHSWTYHVCTCFPQYQWLNLASPKVVSSSLHKHNILKNELLFYFSLPTFTTHIQFPHQSNWTSASIKPREITQNQKHKKVNYYNPYFNTFFFFFYIQ